jgi:hypothetical protein
MERKPMALSKKEIVADVSINVENVVEILSTEINMLLEETDMALPVVYGAMACAIEAVFDHAPSDLHAMRLITTLLDKKLEFMLEEGDDE